MTRDSELRTLDSRLQTLDSPSLIHLQDVSKVYGTGEGAVRAVDRVNLNIRTGELVLILGPSGAGKTTLLSLIGGLLQPTSGPGRVAGPELYRLLWGALSRFRSKQIGFFFNFFNFRWPLTAGENVEVVLRLGGYTPRGARKQAGELLDRLGLSQRLTHLPADL